jgi:hypothetical protein
MYTDDFVKRKDQCTFEDVFHICMVTRWSCVLGSSDTYSIVDFIDSLSFLL